MAAGAGYIEFTTGDILTATAANEYLASQVVMVFASASARTSAIASPQEGMMSYLKDTNSTEYYSGSAWVAIGGSSGALTFIKKVDFTSASTIDFSDSFSSTYDNYWLSGTFTSTDNGDLNFRYRVSGADNTTSNYHFQLADILGTGTNIARITSQTAGRLCGIKTGGPTQSLSAFIYAPYLSKTKNWIDTAAIYSDANIYINQISGGFSASTSFTGMTVYPSAGTVTGSLYLYGYKNS